MIVWSRDMVRHRPNQETKFFTFLQNYIKSISNIIYTINVTYWPLLEYLYFCNNNFRKSYKHDGIGIWDIEPIYPEI